MRGEQTHVDQDVELASFRDYWRSTTKNPMKRDWNATYRNWIRRAGRNANGQRPARPSTTDALIAATQALKHNPPELLP